ncbi:hypothetical protein E2320_022438 [Naja naja]|nr:hypothetical protein E2320_022438 [Naja naja]
MFPRVENVENPLYFQIWALPEELAQGKSQNIGQKTQLLTQSSDFEKHIIFIFPRVEKFDNPLHFGSGLSLRKWKSLKIHFILVPAFPEQFSQGISKNDKSYPKAYLKMWVELNSVEDITFDSELGFRKTFIFMFPARFEKTSFSCPRWKSLKIHFIFRSGLSLRSCQGKSQNDWAENITLKQSSDFEKPSFSYSPWWKTLKSTSFSILGFLRSYPRHISKCWVELNSARKHNL